MHMIIRAGVAAAAFTLASGSALATPVLPTANLSATGAGSQIVTTATNGAFGNGSAITAVLWTVNYNSNTFLAFCLDPKVAVANQANSYSSSVFAASDSIKRLYENYYEAATTNIAGKSYAAFQLALWELNNDNSNLLDGELKFRNLNNAYVKEADAMLKVANGNGAIKNTYSYTSLISKDPASDKLTSQTLLTISPVPEAQTWAMLVAGLGLLGFMSRRRKAGQA